ncbi:Non-specific serine/threonine protein kinase protein [Dioscorea alata]|uniref:Non-specific serine/threonine protein kinase protein n=2 Tax=Dioscorea alata TaxID=55571 RepID=A0ACB7WCT6_DIOAL|nr:Non-specific serine/threonine protein kinase protein [Dioscorea alata]KAH7685531.1 Non-specific serine/threonine protein kinase protein [Dioscorea alata]
MMRGFVSTLVVVVVALFCLIFHVLGQTDSGDFAILEEFHKGLENSELLKWPLDTDKDPCGSKWPHVFCEDSRVTQIQVQNMGLSGPLPQNFNQLSMLSNIGLQRNNFSGKLPSFNGLSNLKFAYLGSNQFDTIPSDFFVGLTSLQVLSLDQNPLNQSTGWRLPLEFENSAQLMNLSLIGCNLVGPIPEFLGRMSSLTVLKLSYNTLTGEIPASLSGSALQILWLNNQKGTGLTGSIDIITSMVSLTDVWLHGNLFTGMIPDSIGALSSLQRLWLNNNQLVGLVPENLTTLPQLQNLQLQNNKLMGPIPEFSFPNFTYASNSFCQSKPGVPCSPEVTALLDFLADLNYPVVLADSWSGNDPCSLWRGVSCLNNKVSVINLPNLQLNGTISPSIGKLDSLADIRLGGNNLTGQIPQNLTNLKSLKMLDVSSNNLAPPLPKFNGVKLNIDGNPLLNSSTLDQTPPPPDGDPTPSAPGGVPTSPNEHHGNNSNNTNSTTHSNGSKKNVVIYIVPVAVVVLIILPVSMFLYFCRRRANAAAFSAPSSIVVHPRDPSDPDNMVKIAVASNIGTTSVGTSDLQSSVNSGMTEAHVIESGNLVVSVQILRGVTRSFSPENELGRGGFGVVYKGELHDGTMIAVKRMEAAVISSKALDEFQSEIAVLSKVRHRNLVSLLGYSVEGNERLLVYEYMPQGALSKHLFQWEQFKLEPLSWKKRLNIALDVARAMEYLHNLAHQCFIHRDLKSSNILLGDDYRAKVSDFGLVKLAPDGKNSVVTRLAGTFGYLAPEYAVTGKITTKADVFSFGVVLMELVTGLIALDENRPEEKRYLASWFCQIKSNPHKLRDAIDKALDVTDETFESISTIAELAGHCAAREPHQRPDMGHAVNVLAPLVEKWKPMKDDQEEYLGIDLRQPLLQMVKGWQDADSTNVSSISYNDSKGSIPSRPDGFAESFTSADGR